MATDVAEVGQVLRNSTDVKAHSSIFWELMDILDKINCIFPAIESARPRCMSGIKELCILNNTIVKIKLLLQNCSESSKLYLALTGEATVQRCERIRSTLDQSLCQIQNMVPQLLAVEIAGVVEYIRHARFTIDSTEFEAGKALIELLRQRDSNEELEFEAFKIVALRLNIKSSKDLLVERRSLKKILDTVHGTDPKKEKILCYFLYLLKNYGKKVKPDVDVHKENPESQGIISSISSRFNGNKYKINDESTDHGELDVPPKELCCPISCRLMHNPVVIASGQTYERVCIEKWFGDGHDTCPKTLEKLENLSMIPNTCMKDLIYHWCTKHGVDIHDLCFWEPSHCNSISSLKDVSTTLLNGKIGDHILQNAQLFYWSDDYQRCQSFSNFGHDMYQKFLYDLFELPGELQDKAVEDLKILLANEETCHNMLSNGFSEALVIFLKNAKEMSNVQAQRKGAHILLSCLSSSRFETPFLSDDAVQLLASFLGSEITKEALMIMQKLTHHSNFRLYIAASGVPPSVIQALNFEDTDILKPAVRILYDLSLYNEIKAHISSSGCISRLVLLLNDRSLAEFCIRIMGNLSDIEEVLVIIAETNGSLASIAELLETGNHVEQENAVAILHSFCSHSFEYSQLVMREGIIPSLVDISVNGNSKGRESSLRLLHHLRDLRNSNIFASLPSQSGSTRKSTDVFIDQSTKPESTSKSSGFFRGKRRFFSKPRSLTFF